MRRAAEREVEGVSSCCTLPSPADCGYSTSATEHLSIPNVQAGEVYVVLLTNFARVTQALSAELDAANTAVLSCAAVAIKEQQQRPRHLRRRSPSTAARAR